VPLADPHCHTFASDGMVTPAELVDAALNAMISQLDLFPTLCDLLQIEPPRWLEGKSIMPVLQGKTDEINEAVERVADELRVPPGKLGLVLSPDPAPVAQTLFGDSGVGSAAKAGGIIDQPRKFGFLYRMSNCSVNVHPDARDPSALRGRSASAMGVTGWRRMTGCRSIR